MGCEMQIEATKANIQEAITQRAFEQCAVLRDALEGHEKALVEAKDRQKRHEKQARKAYAKIRKLDALVKEAIEQQDFERCAQLRDEIKTIEANLQTPSQAQPAAPLQQPMQAPRLLESGGPPKNDSVDDLLAGL